MLTKDKILKLYVPFTKTDHGEEDEDEDEDLSITGHASTNDEDRTGDIIVTEAWRKEGALTNYLKNPIILAFHDPSRPIGKTVSHEVDEKGLKITARISKVAGDIIALIKDGILTAFSIGFMIKDASFDPDSGVFVIKELELFEVSVVSIPANQNAIFNVEKNFNSSEEYKEFRDQFIKSKSKETLMVDKTKDTKNEDRIDIAALTAQISVKIKSDLDADKKAKEETEKAEEEAAKRVEVTAVTAAERVIKKLREELVEKENTVSDALKEVKDSLKALIENGELQAVFTSENDGKMKYVKSDDDPFKDLTTNQKDGLLYVNKILGVPLAETKLLKDYVKKSGLEHFDPGVVGQWEDEYSTRIQNALREQLVVEPLFTTIPMTTPTLNMPINPEAGDATWVHSAAIRSSQNPADESGDGTDTSTGAAVDHQIDEQTLIAFKLATREYIGYEEEEDSIVALAPVINDAIARRMARTSDLAFLRGAGILTNTPSYDPIVGLENRGANTTDIDVAGGANWEAAVDEDQIADLRRNLGLYGLDPTLLVLITSHDYFYELMKLPNFKTVDVMGERATLLTGSVGSIFGVPILVSQQFNNSAITAGTVGTTLAIMVYARNFVTGILRGIITEADRDIINQKRVIVSSRRFAFQDIITGEGTVNLQIAS